MLNNFETRVVEALEADMSIMAIAALALEKRREQGIRDSFTSASLKTAN